MSCPQQSLNLRYIAMKAEVTPGTYIDPLAADFDIRFRDIGFDTTIAMDNENAKYATGDHGEDESIAGAQMGTVTASVNVAYSSSALQEPKWWKAAKACGCDVVTYAGTGLGLVRRMDKDCTTYSIAVYDKELGDAPVTTITKFAGCTGNMVIGAAGVGAPLTAAFTFTGKLVDVVDGSAIALTSPNTTVAETYINSATDIFGSATSGAAAPRVGSFSFDLGNEVVPVFDQSDATGYDKFVIASTRPRLSINLLGRKQNSPPLGNWLSDIISESSGPVILPTANMELKLLDTQLITHAPAERDGMVAWDHTFKCLRAGLSSGEYEVEDTFELLHGARA